MRRMVTLSFFLFIFWVPAFSQKYSDERSLPDVKTLTFLPTPSSSQLILNHTSGRDDALLLRAYAAGLEAIKTYHDQVLTRGSRGIALFKEASPAVVLVVVGRVENGNFAPTSLGTGAIVDTRGYVLTNWHVINGFDLAIVFTKPAVGSDPASSAGYVAKVVAQDLTRDLALLRINNPPPSLPFLKVGDISKAEVAEDIHIIGHPHGKYWSYSTGVISQIRQDYDWSYEDGTSHKAKVIQMQTAINPGNSGGPVLDDSGQMIGLVAMGESGQNLNYAIAADELNGFIARNLISTRGVSAPVIDNHTSYKLKQAQSNDWQVTRVEDNRGISYLYVRAGRPIAFEMQLADRTIITATDFHDGVFHHYVLKGRSTKITADNSASGLINIQALKGQ